MSFLVNPVSEHELRHQKYLDDYKTFIRQQSERDRIVQSRRFELEAFGQQRQLFRQQQINESVREPARLGLPLTIGTEKPTNEPEEVYLPFGKPGGGAQLRKYSSLPFRQVEPQLVLRKTPASYEEIPIRNKEYDSQRRIEKEQQQKFYRDTLNKQLQIKKRREADQKQLKLEEEKLDEERIRKQLVEIETEHRFEKQQVTRSAVFEDVRTQYESPRKKQRQIIAAKRSEEAQVYYPRPRPIHEKFRLPNDTTVQQAALQIIMMKIREAAEAAKRESIESIREFDQIRLELKMKGNSYKSYEIPITLASQRQVKPLRKWQLSESKFIPLKQAGVTIVKPKVFNPEGEDYFCTSDELAKEQLARLDEMLKYQLRTEQPKVWVDDPSELQSPKDLGEITSYIVED